MLFFLRKKKDTSSELKSGSGVSIYRYNPIIKLKPFNDMKKYFPSSELIINEDGSVFHLHVKPEWLADKVILVGDPGRVALVASHFENKECEVESREFKTINSQ